MAESCVTLAKLALSSAEHLHCMAPSCSCFAATQMAESCHAVSVSLDSEAECIIYIFNRVNAASPKCAPRVLGSWSVDIHKSV